MDQMQSKLDETGNQNSILEQELSNYSRSYKELDDSHNQLLNDKQ